MLNRALIPLLALLFFCAPILAATDDARWSLVLAWSPQYCKSHGNPKEPQCIESNLFVPAALQPQGLDGSTCLTNTVLAATQVDRLASLTQNAREARELWRTVGGCAGLPFDEYSTQFDYAGRRLNVPEPYTAVTKRVVVEASEIRQQFIQANEDLTAEGLRLQCKGSELVGVTVCLTSKMKFTQCGSQLVDNCGDKKVLLRAPSR